MPLNEEQKTQIRRDFSTRVKEVNASKDQLQDHQVSQEDMLELYSLFKQATVGNAPEDPKHSFYELEKKAKWEAWYKYHGTSELMAMLKYIKKADELKHDMTPEPQ